MCKIDSSRKIIYADELLVAIREDLTIRGAAYAAVTKHITTASAVEAAPVVHGQWLINPDGYYPYCSNCKTEPKHGDMTDYCPKCGAIMDLPKITGEAATALDRIGAKSHGEE